MRTMLLGVYCRRTRAAAGVVLAMNLASQRAAAQQAPSADDAGAQRIAAYRAGVEASAAGRWAEARQHFADALAMRASPKVYFSLAQAEEQLGQVASAFADYGHALESARTAGESDVVTAAEQARRAIEPRVPHVRVQVSGATGATATVDGQSVDPSSPVPVDPGAHRLVVSAPGMQSATANIAISERQQLDIPLQLEPAESEEPAAAPTPAAVEPPPVRSDAPSPDTSNHSPWRTVGLVAVGAGVLGLGAGGYFALDAKSKNDQSNMSGCVGNNCSPAAASLRRDAVSAANDATVAFVVGGLLSAGGVALWVLAPSGNGAVSAGVTPVAASGGGGAMLTGAWQ